MPYIFQRMCVAIYTLQLFQPTDEKKSVRTSFEINMVIITLDYTARRVFSVLLLITSLQ